jgi:nitroimidazol reductase NimA-like FMN-containing flavoprotein (pyridoxamine 5'-phosphate oxidase superfamily)
MPDIVLEQTERTRIRRLPERSSYDRDTIHSILDEALICHLGFVVDGRPVVIPTIHARVGDHLYFHGSPAAGMFRNLKEGAEACVTVTIVDGLVIARSGFHSSMNYRSVVVFGKAVEVTDPDEKVRVLSALIEHVCRGRIADLRPHSEKELKQTIVLRIPIEEASAKIRTGPPKDDDDDYALPVWAGVLPLAIVPGAPQPDNDRPLPEYIARYRR